MSENLGLHPLFRNHFRVFLKCPPEVLTKCLLSIIIYVMEKYFNDPYLKILQSANPNEQITIRSEYAKAAYNKLNEEDKMKLKPIIRQLCKIHNLGEIGAIQLLATLGQVFDAADWPKGNGYAD